MTTCPFGLGLLRVCILSFTFPSFFFFFFFPACVNSFCTVHAHGFTVQETKSAVHRTYKHFFQKKKIYIKNGSQGTIYTCKNYFATVFSVFSFQQNKLFLNGLYIFWKSNHWLHAFYILNTHIKFCDIRILFTIWCITLFLIHNFKLQKLAI